MAWTSALPFAGAWVGIALLYTLGAFGIGRLIFWRHVASQGPLLAAVALVTFGVTNLVLEDIPFAAHYPFFSTPVRALFFMYFIVFAGGQFVMRGTRWLLIVFGLGVLSIPSPHAALGSLSSQASLAWLEEAGRVFPILVALAPQMVRYRDRAPAGERWPTSRVLAGCGVGLVLLFVSAWLAQVVNGSTLFFFVRTAWYTLLSLAPIAIGLALIGGKRYDLAALQRRALIYGSLTVGLSLIFFALLAASPVLLPLPTPTQAGVPAGLPYAATILASLLLVFCFPPGRRLVQAGVDRWRYPQLQEMAQKFAEFGATAGEEVRMEALSEQTLGLIQATLRPGAATLWARTQLAAAFEEPPPPMRGRARASSFPTGEPAVSLYCCARTDRDSARPPALTIAPGDPLLPALVQAGGPLPLESPPASDSPAAACLRAVRMESALGLVDRGKLVGLICLSEQPRSFDERELLTELANGLAPALRIAQREHEQDEQSQLRERIEQEMQTAQRIQRAFLPQVVPSLTGWQIVPYYQPAREVGGDFYDFLMLPDGRLGIVIGDVSGKGVPAALVMAATRSMLRASAQQLASPGEVLAQVNELLHGDLPASVFVTCFYAILEPSSGRMRYANAGHELPYHRCGGAARQLDARGMPLGLMPGSGYEEQEGAVQRDDSLLFYTDGLVEAHNPRREMFGSSRVAHLVAAEGDGQRIIEQALAELAGFTRPDWEQEDDITLVTLRWHSPAGE
jgi:serine phosphatase RsbU (regulator of sigma subunit)